MGRQRPPGGREAPAGQLTADGSASVRVAVGAQQLRVRGGLDRVSVEVSRTLAERGHLVDLVHVDGGELLDDYRRFCHRVVAVDDFYVRPTEPVRTTSAVSRAARRIAALAPDVAWVNTVYDTFVFGAAGRLGHFPVVCHLHTPPPLRFTHQTVLGLAQVSRFVAVSGDTRQRYVAAGLDGALVDVVHNGVDPARYPLDPGGSRQATRAELGLPDDAFVVLYAGRLEPEKGVGVLIDAFAALDLPPTAARLVVAGTITGAADPAAAASHVSALRRRARADATHWLDARADVVPLYHAADVVVLPSVYEEPFARVVLEAMACGRPVVATRMGGTPEMLTDRFASHLVEPGDVRGLAGTLTALRTWQVDRPALAEECRAHVGLHFSMAASVDGIETAFTTAATPPLLRHGQIRRLWRYGRLGGARKQGRWR